MKKDIHLSAGGSLWTARNFAWLMVGVYALLSLREVYPTLMWPYVVDSPLMHYIAWRLLEGDAPYRDIYDMNFPVAYLHHVLVVSLFGYSDLSWRIFTLVWAGWISLGAYLFCRRDSKLAGGIAALLVWFMGYVMGPAHAGQRDFFLCGYVMWSAVAAFAYLEYPTQRPPAHYAVMAGVLMALGCWTKPVVGAMALVFGLYFMWRGAYTLLRLYVLGGVLTSAVIAAWLALQGSLLPLLNMILEYLLPVYSQYDRSKNWMDYVYTASWVLILMVTFFIPRRPTARGWFMLILCGCGVAHHLLQGKGWGYHAYPLMVFFAAHAGMALGQGFQHKQSWVRVMCLVFMWGIFDVYLHEKPMQAYDYAPEMQMVEQLKEDLPALKEQGYESVQIFDTSNGVLHGLLRMKVKNMSPFMYDFMLLEPPLNDYSKQMRRQFEEMVKTSPPDSIIISLQSWPDDDRPYAQKLAAYPYLESLLATRYNQWKAGDGYRIYVRKKAHL